MQTDNCVYESQGTTWIYAVFVKPETEQNKKKFDGYKNLIKFNLSSVNTIYGLKDCVGYYALK